jgi:hypothetical protein
MNCPIKPLVRVLLVISFLFAGMLSGPSDVQAQEKNNTLAPQIQGSWILVSVYNEQDGKKTEPYGSNPKGFMVLDPHGRFSIILMRAGLPKFAADNRVKGTAEENQAVVHGSLALYGTYTAKSEKEPLVILRIGGCTFPNWDGTDQKRVMIVEGDEMKLTNLSPTTGGIAYLVWKRAG